MEFTTVFETATEAAAEVVMYDYTYQQTSLACLGFIAALLFFILVAVSWK